MALNRGCLLAVLILFCTAGAAAEGKDAEGAKAWLERMSRAIQSRIWYFKSGVNSAGKIGMNNGMQKQT